MKDTARPGRPIGRAALALLVSAVLWAGFPATSATSAVPATSTSEVRRSAGVELDLGGGDVTALPRPRTLRAASSLTKRWTSVPVSMASVPADGVGALLVEAVVRRAKRSGSIAARPAGAAGPGTLVSTYTERGGVGTTVVALGPDDSFEVRASRGSPVTTVRVVGWAPATSQLIVGATEPTSLTLRDEVEVVPLPEVPDGTGVALVRIETNAKRQGVLRAWRAGTPVPTIGSAFGAGRSVTWDVVAAGDNAALALRSTHPGVEVTVSALAWTAATSTIEPVADVRLARIASGKVRTVKLRGRGAVPADASQVWSSLAAPPGARVRIWNRSSASGTPAYDFRSSGSAAPLLLPVPGNGKIAVRISDVRGDATLLAHAAGVVPVGQQVLLEPREGTHLIPSAGLESFDLPNVVLAATEDPVAVDDHLQVRGPDGLPYTLRVTTVTPLADGGQSVTVDAATLPDAFADLRLTYGRPQQPDVEPTPRRVSGAPPLAAGLPGGEWECSPEVALPSFALDFSGSPYLDVNLSAGTVDFSLKGAVAATLGWQGSVGGSCQYSGTLAQIPVGALPVALTLSPSATASFTPAEAASVTIHATSRVYTSLYYDGSDPITGRSLAADADVEATLGDGSAQLDLGLEASIGPAVVGVFTVGPQGSVTLGTSLRLAPPTPEDDPFGRHLAGPRCVDLTNTLYAEFGASVLVPFLPDVQLDIGRYDTPPVTLYRGPCIGYSGTITYDWRGSSEPGHLTCDGVGPSCGEYEHLVVKTLAPGLASFPPWGYVAQPYAWTWNGTETSTVKNWDGTSFNALCTTSDTYTGVGSVTWGSAGESPEGWPAPSIGPGRTRTSRSAPRCRSTTVAAPRHARSPTTTHRTATPAVTPASSRLSCRESTSPHPGTEGPSPGARRSPWWQPEASETST